MSTRYRERMFVHCAIKKHHDAAHEKKAACPGVLGTLLFGARGDGLGRRTYLLSRRRLRSLVTVVSWCVYLCGLYEL
jgi:hypothetical protein